MIPGTVKLFLNKSLVHCQLLVLSGSNIMGTMVRVTPGFSQNNKGTSFFFPLAIINRLAT